MWRSDTPETPEPRGVAGIRVLVADDDEGVRSLFAALLHQAAGVSAVLEVEDGADAVRVVQEAGVQVAVLDLNMPRIDGLKAALKLAALQPSIGLALHSSDLRALRERASGLGIPLFDKYAFGSLVAWVERRASFLSVAGQSVPLAGFAAPPCWRLEAAVCVKSLAISAQLP